MGFIFLIFFIIVSTSNVGLFNNQKKNKKLETHDYSMFSIAVTP